jgi:biotin carboxyl carrier protein
VEHEGDLLPELSPRDDALWLLAAAGLAEPQRVSRIGANTKLSSSSARSGARADSLASMLGPWRHSSSSRSIAVSYEGEVRSICLLPRGDGRWSTPQGSVEIALANHAPGSATIMSSSGERRVLMNFDGPRLHVVEDGKSYLFALADPPSASSEPALVGASATEVRSPLPGVVARRFVDTGATVTASQPLLAIEAMKMEHLIVAPSAGVIRRLPFAVGDAVSDGAILATMEPLEAEDDAT